MADDSGIYIGANVGQVDMPDDVQLGVPNVPLMAGKTDDAVIRPAADIGYRFNRNIALELGYVELGDLKANVTDASGASDANARVRFSASGVSLALVGTFPVGK